MSRGRASDLWTPSREIRAPKGAAFDLVESCRPYIALSQGGVVSHFTAARIHGLYLPAWCGSSEQLHLTRPAGLSEPR